MDRAFYAHTPPDYLRTANRDNWQLLAEHLREVARGAVLRARDAVPVKPTDDAANRRWKEALHHCVGAAGLLHDLGKYRPEFQDHLEGRPVQRPRTYHKQAGAAKAFDERNPLVAFAVGGHHGGMTDAGELKGAVNGDAGRPVVREVWENACKDCPDLDTLQLRPPEPLTSLLADVTTRFVFSCLVDADWSDTAEYHRRVAGADPEPKPPDLDAEGWLDRVLMYIRGCAGRCREERLARCRAEILQACLQAAENGPGLFTLTVPTGGGKTLSGLAFTLRHAARHGLRRIIYVAPYLSILDQNARVIRDALGVGRDNLAVFEHHSLAEPPGAEDENETDREAAARRAESWDAPVVLTTSVQFFESLFANKPGRCRKLHNIARSVVLLDECQTLPPDLVAPTCSMLKQLTTDLGSSVVLCTATQPAFDNANMPKERLENVREIIPEPLRRRDQDDLFVRLQRVQVAWPKKGDIPLGWPDIVQRMRDAKQALCIVNTRRAARELFAELKRTGGDAFHLSTSMCPAHRLAVLDEVRKRLDDRRPCYLASTQLIEAGVDVDFPFVLRELAPLEAVIQSAGRCNREGKLKGPDGSPGGRVLVFRSVEGALPADRWYRAGRAVLESSFLNNGREPRIDHPADIAEYFERLYWTGELDAGNLQAARQRFEFATVAKGYRLIDDHGVAAVVASWEEKREEVEALLDAVRGRRSRANFRKLALFQVNLKSWACTPGIGAAIEELPGVFVWRGGYDCETGLDATGVNVLLLV
jgi:CRISPR-associated endonuclease/helicase Cas3